MCSELSLRIIREEPPPKQPQLARTQDAQAWSPLTFAPPNPELNTPPPPPISSPGCWSHLCAVSLNNVTHACCLSQPVEWDILGFHYFL